MFRKFLQWKKKPKVVTPHKFMHESRLINNTCFRHKEERLKTWEQTRIVQGKLQN